MLKLSFSYFLGKNGGGEESLGWLLPAPHWLRPWSSAVTFSAEKTNNISTAQTHIFKAVVSTFDIVTRLNSVSISEGLHFASLRTFRSYCNKWDQHHVMRLCTCRYESWTQSILQKCPMLMRTRIAPTLVFKQAASTEASQKATSKRKTFIPVTRALQLADVVSSTHMPSIPVRADSQRQPSKYYPEWNTIV